MNEMKVWDVVGLVICWLGAGGIAYLARDGVITTVCVASAYYLSKWIITRKGSIDE